MGVLQPSIVHANNLQFQGIHPLPQAKIVGGNFALPGEFPFQLMLTDAGGDQYCGAVLITTMLALTAAHCVEGISMNSIYVKGGKHMLEESDGTEQRRTLQKIIIHEVNATHYGIDDIALIVLKEEFHIDDYTSPIALPNFTSNFKGMAIASGWGFTTETHTSSSSVALKKIKVPIIEGSKCQSLYDDLMENTRRVLFTTNNWYDASDKVICAGGAGGGVFDGDSGGPLVCIGDQGKKYLCGIALSGRGSPRTTPGIYTKVSKYIPWIESKISTLREPLSCGPDNYRCTLNHDFGSKFQKERDPCDKEEFHCGISQICIPLLFRCDGEVDCGSDDRSDEIGCPSDGSIMESDDQGSCTFGEFQCKASKKCISAGYKCDGDFDCGDGDRSDELHCDSCSADEFHCVTSKKCIPLRYRCDGDYSDCGGGDRSDEVNCTRATTTVAPTTTTSTTSTTAPSSDCTSGQFQCVTSRKCIQSRYKCDGDFDCGVGDRSDELNCCSPGQFQCVTSKRCIPLRYKCDGDYDCGGGDRSDEVNCTRPTATPASATTPYYYTTEPDFSTQTIYSTVAPSTCSSGEFQCAKSKKCIPNQFKCDQDYDCGAGDRSDEEGCGVSDTPTPGYTIAPTIPTTIPTTEGIGSTTVGRITSTTAPSSNCSTGQFQCEITGKCISLSYVCDADDDCGGTDRSDEENCASVGGCHPTQFFCDESCVSGAWRCDGEEDCEDGTDERNCNQVGTTTPMTLSTGRTSMASSPTTTLRPSPSDPAPLCNSDQFQCLRSQKCIHKSFVCDQEVDCGPGDDSDEANCLGT